MKSFLTYQEVNAGASLMAHGYGLANIAVPLLAAMQLRQNIKGGFVRKDVQGRSRPQVFHAGLGVREFWIAWHCPARAHAL